MSEALGELVGAAREGLLALSVGVGLGVLAELMEEEVVEVVGRKGKHDPDRSAVRHGHEAGEVTLELVRRTHSIIDSHGLVDARVRLRDPVTLSRVMVSVSVMPSRSEEAAPGWVCSSSAASRVSFFRARS